ncbi:hypothetical protein EZY14_012890 [Kordia sp. TARA_039_SRF]|nr:hypothetical protein EZY14_012890 [Kordia sp. TARA_039_SRF]
MLQMFFPVNNETIIDKRKEQRTARSERDSKRIEAIKTLYEIKALNILDDSLNDRVSNLLSEHDKAEQNSETLYNELLELKELDKVRNFADWNAFWGSMGNPFFLLITGIIFILLFIFRRNIDWISISKSFIYLGLMYIFVSLVYLIWGFSNSLEIHKIYYIVGLIFAGIFATFGLNYLIKCLFQFSHTGEERYKKIIRILFQQILHDIPENGFIKEDKMNEFTESNTEIISKVYKEVD